MSYSIFLSYVYEDKLYADEVQRWAKEYRLLPEVVTVREGRDVRQGGDAEIDRMLRQLISGCAAVVTLVGNDTHNHAWVSRELRIATSKNKPTLLMRIPLTRGARPKGFEHLDEVDFKASALRDALAQYW